MYATTVNTSQEFRICCQIAKRVRNEKVIIFWLLLQIAIVHFEQINGLDSDSIISIFFEYVYNQELYFASVSNHLGLKFMHN